MLCAMWTRHRLPVVVPLLALLFVCSACTGDDQSRRAGHTAPPDPTPTATATGPAPRLHEHAEPYRVRYRRMAGQVPRPRREHYRRVLSAPVRQWVDRAFVEGTWPRGRYRSAFLAFRPGITARAKRDGDLLTWGSTGTELSTVVPQRRRIGLSVTTVGRGVVGATARVDLRMLAVARDGSRRRATLRGDLYLTRVEGHGWKIFGYDLSRWDGDGATSATARKGGTR